MARRSSSNRWSRPATGKQIAALKSGGSYDGKYYSMGRASQSIGGSAFNSSAGPPRSSGNASSGSAYSPLAVSGFGPSGLLSRLIIGNVELGSLLQPALGASPQSRLASSEAGPMRILSELLGVPDDLDSLVQVALGGDDSDGSSVPAEDGPVEAVSFTVFSDDSNPAEPRIVVEANVVRNLAFNGKPSLEVRFMGAGGPSENQALDRALQPRVRPVLGYRPTWTSVLVRTPAELAEQMRAHWGAATKELEEGVDPRLATFLARSGGMETALEVLNSGQSTASMYVHLQGILDPDGPIQFHGLGLDAATFAEQIRMAHEGDEQALTWLEVIQRLQVLTSLAEVTGISLAAEADFRLACWHKQGTDLIGAVTMDADDSGFDFTSIRALLTMRAENEAKYAELRASLAEGIESNPETSADDQTQLDRLDALFPPASSSEYGLLEDWFFEETRIYLQARLRQSLPGQFAVALMPSSSDRSSYDSAADEVRRLVTTSSTDLNDYSPVPASSADSSFGSFHRPSRLSQSQRMVNPPERIVQAVRRAVAESEAAGDEDLGTLIISQELLGYAQWKRDELRGSKQMEELKERYSAATQRSKAVRQRAQAAKECGEEVRRHAGLMPNVERVVQNYTDALARTANSISIDEPLWNSAQEAASARIEEAKAREFAAGEWLAAAEEREKRVESEMAVVATIGVIEKLRAEHGAAVTEQADARAERQGAQRDQQDGQDHRARISAARANFDDQIRPVREENLKRLRAEAERRQEAMARQQEERRQKQAVEQERREAANKLQEQTNQRQQERARNAKNALAPELERFLALPVATSFWRRKTLKVTRESLEQAILKSQTEIVAPLSPPGTISKTWPSMLSRTERYLGTVEKLADYGVFVSLPAGADGLLRGSEVGNSLSLGQLVVVEIVDMPYGKPIALKRISR
ncbi:hypothetical protein E3O25_02815 [Cryobacterium sp. TMT1-3]|uniref:Uncharacterized protein n=1 Tax=Cryobacterium luteum TaxID=1424661 RepID=A0A1H8ER01_9MICO|nr:MULTISPECIES: hypothetical protein [Cryobacterium]TFB85777.1 hypothetical protein E3O10_14565 [Cryobacterium luteum]TFC31386.1 hypothetical protein E3O25_02815 [Cryobacterium sp. TMT1-3]SEN21564.1 hypothetical protein SAMN05216281_10525 [Cryobacterium luteum]